MSYTKSDLGWSVAGIFFLALVSGILVGASSTPVAGVALTAVLGVAAASLSRFKSSPEEAEPLSDFYSPRPLKYAGIALTIFSISLAVGVSVGAWLRVQYWPKLISVPTEFPWPVDKPPASAETALDWISIREQLAPQGYSLEQIRALYIIDEGWKTKPLAEKHQLTSPTAGENRGLLEHVKISPGEKDKILPPPLVPSK